MKKPAVSDEECIARLQAAVDALAQSGASPYDIVTAFLDVAINLAVKDRAYEEAQLKIVGAVFSAGASLARLRLHELEQAKTGKKK